MVRTRITPRNTSLRYGESLALQLADDVTFVGATTKSYTATIQSTGALVSLNVMSTAGNIQVSVYNMIEDGEELKGTFPLISSPTSDILTLRVNDVSGNVRIEVITSDSASLELRIKAAESITDSDAFQGDVTGGVNDSALVVQNPAITNITMGLAGTESTITFPANTKRYLVKARGNSTLQFSYISGQTGVTYWTEFPGFTLDEYNVDNTSTVLYVQASKDNEILEIKTWT
jgi:hypothetical protein